MPAAMRRWRSACALAALSVGACSDSRLVDGFSEGQTRIRVSPEAFVGGVPCLRGAAGALHGYVARLQQVGADGQLVGVDGGASTALVSGPVPCDRAVLFPGVAGRLYTAEIFGFDRDLTEAEAPDAIPRWLAVCGQGSPSAASDAGVDPLGPTLAVRGSTVSLGGCTTFSELTPGPGRSQLAIDVDSALGELSCGSGPGQVGFLQAALGSSQAFALCGDPLVLEVDGPARYHTVVLTAFELGPDAGVGLPDGGLPSGPPTALDAGPALADAAVDASPGDAGVAPSTPAALDAGVSADAGLTEAGVPEPSWVGIPRWRSECIGRSLPGITSVATCEALQPLGP
jgi:hypothetical protein